MNLDKIINIKKKYILITGANGFIGLKLASILIKLGANLILTDKVDNPKKLKKILATKNARYFSCDLTSKNSITSFKKNIIKQYKKIDVIVHNASFTGDNKLKGWASDFMSQSTDNWDQVFQVAVKVNFDLNQSFLKLLKKSKNPSIINISSIYGFKAPDWELYRGTNVKNPAGYGVSKSALIYLTKWLANTLGPNIRVNSISPGGIKRNQSNKFIIKYKKKVSLGRMAKEEDVAMAVIFLASDMAKYITGQNIIVDGGFTL